MQSLSGKHLHCIADERRATSEYKIADMSRALRCQFSPPIPGYLLSDTPRFELVESLVPLASASTGGDLPKTGERVPTKSRSPLSPPPV
ncbi:hypothetical protein R1flu_027875 [Riccia fluitans]|uniref:Uncharacterized protein n=1 Tax=Riccia fluitans TaxID=41844 RepID=A0ABD1XK32_9MARC